MQECAAAHASRLRLAVLCVCPVPDYPEERAPPSDAFVMCVLPTFAALSDETLRRYTLGPLTFLTRERAAFPG